MAVSTNLHNHVEMGWGIEHLIQSNDIWMANGLHDLDLRFEGVFVFFLEVLLVDDLDSPLATLFASILRFRTIGDSGSYLDSGETPPTRNTRRLQSSPANTIATPLGALRM